VDRTLPLPVPPVEILIFSGRKHRWPTDHRRIARRVRRARLAHPIIETVQRMQMLAMPIDVAVAGRLHEGGDSAEGPGDRGHQAVVRPVGGDERDRTLPRTRPG
jgi:hypothetical protein